MRDKENFGQTIAAAVCKCAEGVSSRIARGCSPAHLDVAPTIFRPSPSPEPLMSQARAKAEGRRSVPSDGRNDSPLPIQLKEQDPGLGGEFWVCTETPYSFTNQTTSPKHNYYGQIYIPGKPSQLGCVTSGTFPLVVVVHANGIPNHGADKYHLQYALLARHLVSHGYIVVSVNRGISPKDDWEDSLGDLLEETVHFLFTKHFIRTFLQDSVSVIGHSSGGKRVLEQVWRIAKPINLWDGKKSRSVVAVIIMSCTISNWNQSAADKVAQNSRAFLGINVVNDSDFDAYGSKAPGKEMKSTFWPYDTIGSIAGTKDLLRVTKDMIFALAPGAGHFYQDRAFVHAFITAFLHRHVNHSLFYDRFVKLQEVPSSVNQFSDKFFFLHENFQKLSIANFDGADSRLSSVIAGNVKIKNVTTFIDDEFSPHVSTALRIDWDRSKPPGSFLPQFVELKFKTSVNLSNFSFLSFRMTQGYPITTSAGPAFDVLIKIDSTNSFVVASKHGGPIHYPIKATSPVPMIQPEQTKTAMHTYLIPLIDFNTSLSAISKIRFDFSVNPTTPEAKAIFYLGKVEFIS